MQVDDEHNKHFTSLSLKSFKPQAPSPQDGKRRITLLHFNDAYNIEPASREPVGGASRIVGKVSRP